MKTTSKDTKIAALQSVGPLRGCRDRDLAKVARLLDETAVDAGTVLTVEDTRARQSFIVVEGEASISRGGTSIATVGPGEFLGEMAMLDGGPRSATATALTPMRLLVIGPESFASFVDDPAVSRGMATLLARRLREIQR